MIDRSDCELIRQLDYRVAGESIDLCVRALLCSLRPGREPLCGTRFRRRDLSDNGRTMPTRDTLVVAVRKVTNYRTGRNCTTGDYLNGLETRVREREKGLVSTGC